MNLPRPPLRLLAGIMHVLAIVVVAYAVLVYALLPLGAVVHPDMRLVFVAHKTAIYTHVFASSVALLLGPLQFWPRIRDRNRRLHRWLGRIYLGIGVLLGGVSGLYMATLAFGGMVAKLGFACLALAWLYTAACAYRAIRRGEITRHRAWMVRNFALTFAAVTLRIHLPLSAVWGIPFEAAYPVIAWLCWVPNLLIAEWVLRRVPMQAAGLPRAI